MIVPEPAPTGQLPDALRFARFFALVDTVRIEDVQNASREARARLQREAAAAGVPAPDVPIWSGFAGEIGSAIAEAHRRRGSVARGATPQVRALLASHVPARAERARRLLEPRRP